MNDIEVSEIPSEYRSITVITYGTFDLFHVGHLNLLRRLKSFGDRLVVGVSSGEFNALKGKITVMPYAHRAEIVSAVRYVDGIFPEECWEQKRDDVLREKAGIFAMGSDWIGKFDDLKDLCEVVYLPRTENISSTEVKDVVRAEIKDKFLEISHLSDVLQALIKAALK
jgi:glycerol-3-phosphate cytidylyltransferase